MRKYIISILLFVFLLLVFNFDNLVYAMDVSIENTFRMRIIANSDKTKDQLIKNNVKREIEKFLFPKLKKIKSKTEMEELLKQNSTKINSIVKKVLIKNKVKYKHRLIMGDNYFPKKNKYNHKFPAGIYTSMVIKLGEGKGNNWWCILFPPLCLMEKKEPDSNKIEYKSYFVESIKKWFN